jgi:hypothetical protein
MCGSTVTICDHAPSMVTVHINEDNRVYAQYLTCPYVVSSITHPTRHSGVDPQILACLCAESSIVNRNEAKTFGSTVFDLSVQFSAFSDDMSF